jgi:hypothetical protein
VGTGKREDLQRLTERRSTGYRLTRLVEKSR